jgi:transcriptional regulator with XRE-family HTH domain
VALHAARTAEGLTRAQLAVALGVDPSTVARWEEGVSYPSPMALVALRARFPGVGL